MPFTIKGGHISGARVAGIRADGVDLHVDGMTFEDNRQDIVGTGGRLFATNCKFSDESPRKPNRHERRAAKKKRG